MLQEVCNYDKTHKNVQETIKLQEHSICLPVYSVAVSQGLLFYIKETAINDDVW